VKERIRWSLLSLPLLAALVWWGLRASAHQDPRASQSVAARNAGEAVREIPDPPPLTATPPAQPSAMQAEADASPDMQQCQSDFRDAVRARLLRAAQSPNAQDRAGAALLAPVAFGPEAATEDTLASLQSAAERQPRDPLLAWLAASACGSEAECDRTALINRALKLESDNGAVWVLAIDAAMDRNDLTQAERLLHDTARATRFDIHWGDSARLIRATMGPQIQTPACTRAAAELGRMVQLERPGTVDDLAPVMAGTLVPIPSLHGLMRLCAVDAQQVPPLRAADCRAIYMRMADAEELISAMIGLRGMVRYAATRSERVRYRERLRNAYWLNREGGPLLGPASLQLAWEQGEVSVMTALLEEAGRWPAPADWVPESQ
jgi:hypothetical protein